MKVCIKRVYNNMMYHTNILNAIQDQKFKKNFEYFVLFYLTENVLNTYEKIFSNFPFLILILYDFKGHFMID